MACGSYSIINVPLSVTVRYGGDLPPAAIIVSAVNVSSSFNNKDGWRVCSFIKQKPNSQIAETNKQKKSKTFVNMLKHSPPFNRVTDCYAR